MNEINPHFLYWTATRLYQALVGAQIRPPGVVPLNYGKDALVLFVTSWKDNFLPKSKSKAREIIVALDSMILQPSGITNDDVVNLHALATQFDEQLQEECRHLYVLSVEDQRILSAYTLVENIQGAISQKTWRYLSGQARREIEESGKCLSLERYTASGFHVLRCVESVVREYLVATAVALTDAERNWGAYARLLKEHGAADEVHSIVDSIRRDDRNTLMHPEKFLDMDEAIALFFLSLTALDRLVNDMEKRGLAKEFSPTTASTA